MDKSTVTIPKVSGVPLIDGQYIDGRLTRIARSDRDGFRTRQFHVTTAAGWTLSVIWGSGTYSTNYRSMEGFSDCQRFAEDAEEVEIMVWCEGLDDVDEIGENPAGWVPAANIQPLIDAAKTWPPEVTDRVEDDWKRLTERQDES